MLQQLVLTNFTCFTKATLGFGQHLNVIVGENGLGKTHLLKVAYSVTALSAEEGRQPGAGAPTKILLQLRCAEKLLDKGYLFWDEPEANLNPRLIKQVARTIVDVAASGIQVTLATHSLFLLREIEILMSSRRRPLETRFFGLHASQDGVQVMQGQSVDEIGDIAVLDEELAQSDRFLAADA